MNSKQVQLASLAVFLALAAALSGCAGLPQAADPATKALPPATEIAPTAAPIPTATSLPPQGLASAPETQPQPVIMPGASQTTQSPETSGAPTAAMEPQYLALALADEATQVLLSCTEELAGGVMDEAEAQVQQMAVEMVVDGVEEVLGVEVSDHIDDEQLDAAITMAMEALPVVVETAQQLQAKGVTPEQAKAALQGAQVQLRAAQQTAKQAMQQKQQRGQAALSDAQMERLQLRARAQVELAKDAARQRQQNGAMNGAANQIQQQAGQAAQGAAGQIQQQAGQAAQGAAGRIQQQTGQQGEAAQGAANQTQQQAGQQAGQGASGAGNGK